mmetsp:Transcript_18146/g.36541  ORF Transcript_18146/g.36541 Transcript_18146/m.36541 type:complete len:145 (+) Transcript_18146:41-475(+)
MKSVIYLPITYTFFVQIPHALAYQNSLPPRMQSKKIHAFKSDSSSCRAYRWRLLTVLRAIFGVSCSDESGSFISGSHAREAGNHLEWHLNTILVIESALLNKSTDRPLPQSYSSQTQLRRVISFLQARVLWDRKQHPCYHRRRR